MILARSEKHWELAQLVNGVFLHRFDATSCLLAGLPDCLIRSAAMPRFSSNILEALALLFSATSQVNFDRNLGYFGRSLWY